MKQTCPPQCTGTGGGAQVGNACLPVADASPSAVYPAVCHLSIIADSREGFHGAAGRVLAGYEVVSPLSEGGGTPSGRHRALRVSVQVASREELEALDRDLRTLPGVRMVL